jgi:ABC-type polysaccharide/polyol phosphate transport system ATPase subunit
MIARIVRPTHGEIWVRGRVSALLELGAGFHPDLTGRENIFLNGSVLGLSRQEVAASFDSIVAFSELEDFIDMPVKHYSSGMYMRLGFSVAVHVDPDILLIDEILAVGDHAFQDKCVDRIHAMKEEGSTLVFVSHNLDQVRRLCSQLVWVENGIVRATGAADKVIAQYTEHTYRQKGRQFSDQVEPFPRWGTGEIEIVSVRILNDEGKPDQLFQTNDAMIFEMKYVAHRPVHNPEFGLAIFREDGVHVNGPNSRTGDLDLGTIEGSGVIRYHIEQLPLLPGRYSVTAAVHDSRLSKAYDHHERAYEFRIVPGGSNEIHGLIVVPAHWEWEKSETAVLTEEIWTR